jgi:CRISPR/Cas system-associated exonuclease Cas4 (RecB family)
MIIFYLFLVAIAALLAGNYLRSRTSVLPAGAVIYSDTDRTPVYETLVSHRYQLAGRPDYVLATPEGMAPVELKRRRSLKGGPRDGDRAQLYTYCLLLEDTRGVTVHQGYIEYSDRRYAVPFGSKERRYIIGVLDEMRGRRRAANVGRDHAHAGKCRACGFNAPGICGQELAPPYQTR